MAVTWVHGNVSTSAVINDNDRGAEIVIVASLCMVCSLCFLGARLLIRWPWSRLFEKDDAATCLATLMSSAQTILVLVTVRLGLGKRDLLLSHDELLLVKKLVNASNLMFLFSMFGGRIAIALLFLRLSFTSHQIWYARAIVATAAVFGTIAVVLAGIHNLVNRASFEYARLQAVGVMSVAMEIFIISFPIYLIWGNTMKRHSKYIVVAIFLLRTPIVALLIIRIVEVSKTVGHADYAYNYVLPEIITQLEMHFNLISATVPCMRLFLATFDTGFLATTMDQLDKSYNYSGDTSSRSAPDDSGSSRNRPDSFQLSRTSLRRHLNGPEEFRCDGSQCANAVLVEHSGPYASDSTNNGVTDSAIVVKQSIEVSYNHSFRGE